MAEQGMMLQGEAAVRVYLNTWACMAGAGRRVRYGAREYERHRAVVVLVSGEDTDVDEGMRMLLRNMDASWYVVKLHVAPAHFDAALSVLTLDDATTWPALYAWAMAHEYTLRIVSFAVLPPA